MKNRKHEKFKKIILLAIDLVLLSVSLLFAYYGTIPTVAIDWKIMGWFSMNLVLTIFCFAVLGLYSMVFQTVSIIEALKVAVAIVTVGFANIIYDVAVFHSEVKFTTTLVFLSFAFYFTLITRFHNRVIGLAKKYTKRSDSPKKRVMIVGAGNACNSLLTEMRNSDKLNYLPVCLIDDITRCHFRMCIYFMLEMIYQRSVRNELQRSCQMTVAELCRIISEEVFCPAFRKEFH